MLLGIGWVVSVDKIRASAGMRSGEVTWVGDIPAPVTTYAASVQQNSLPSANRVPASTAWTRSAAVMRKPRRDGLRYFYSYGALSQPTNPIHPGPADGQVWVSAFQQMLSQLHDWSTNSAWFAAGYPRNLGWTFKVDQINFNSTGGPGPGRANPRPLFPRVQRVPRATVVPPAYNTRSAKA